MIELSEALKLVAPIAVPAVKAAIDELIVPFLKSTWKEHAGADQAQETAVQEAFSGYLLRYYAKLSFVSTLVFQNQQTRLTDIYLPLSVTATEGGESLPMDRWRDEFIPKYKKVLVADTAGMGKSTILKWTFLQAIDHRKKIPIFLELKSLRNGEKLELKLHEELSSFESPFPKKLLNKLLDEGRFLFHFDGYDEIPLEHRASVTADLQDFVSRCGSNWFIISSRKDPGLACFADFKAFSISPLKEPQVYKLIEKYDTLGAYSDSIIQELKNGKYKQLEDLLKNPMMVSLLFKSYTFKPKIPLRKPIFYRQVYDALYEAHDFTKGDRFFRKKNSGLDIEDFHAVLRELGFASAKLGRVELTKDKLLACLREISLRRPDIALKSALFIEDLVTTVPLFQCEGDIYNWAHKSVQDYFAAQFIYTDAREQQLAVLDAIYDSNSGHRFSNVIDILYETEPSLVRHTLIRRLLHDFTEYHAKSYRNDYVNVSGEAIELRRSLTFKNKHVIAIFPSDALNLKNFFEHIKEKCASLVAPHQISSASISMVAMQENKFISIVIANLPGEFIVDLLREKRLDCFSDKKIPLGKGGGDKMRERFLSTEELIAPLLITDSPDNPANASELFRSVNQELGASSEGTLDLAKVNLLLGAIEQERRDLEKHGDLAGGI